MNTKTRRVGAIASAIIAAGAVVLGSYAVASALPGSGSAPAPTSTAAPERSISDSTIEKVEPMPTELPIVEPVAPVVEEPEPYVEPESEPYVEPESEPYVEPESEPYVEPAPAPAPPVAEPAPAPGDQQAGECREYNDANECTAYYVP